MRYVSMLIRLVMNLFRPGKPCMYCGYNTKNLCRVNHSIYRYRICKNCAAKNQS